jgi:hypothetical protein
MAVITETTETEPLSATEAARALLENAANRRMCAGAYLDREFRDSVLRQVYNDRNRRVAPSYGFNVVLVLRHAWRSWWLETCQQILTLALLVIACLKVPLDAVIVIGVLAIWYVLRALPAWLRELASFYSSKSKIYINEHVRARGKLLRNILILSSVVVAVAAVAAASSANRHGQAAEPWPVRSGLVNAAVLLAAFAAIVSAGTAARMIWIGRLNTEDVGVRARDGKRMHVIYAQQYHPITVYSGFRPFIGSGVDVRSWSFAQRLVHKKVLGTEPDQEFEQPPFTTRNLLDHLKQMIYALRDDKNPETRLPGLTVEDHIFIEGTHAIPFHDILVASPGSAEVTETIKGTVDNPSDVARHYLESRVESWGGEVVTSVFVHVSLQGRTLYLEFATYALLPTRAEYHIIDEAGGTGASAVGKAVGSALVRLPEELLRIRRLVRMPVQLWAALCPNKDRTGVMAARVYTIRRHFRAVSIRRPIDIGATASARESAAPYSDETYFQFQDIRQHSKIIERRLIATVGDYLKEQGVDTSEFWQRANAILNSGVINADSGTITISDSAIGDRATVTTAPEQPQAPESSNGQQGATT